jgi:hypothetical protein
MLDLDNVRQEFLVRVGQGMTDEQALIELFRAGHGLLLLAKMYAAERSLSFRQATKQILPCTNGIEVNRTRSAHPSILRNEALEQLLKDIEADDSARDGSY